MISATELARGVDALPLFPASAALLLQKLADPLVTAGELEAIMRPDPVLTARLLKLANSGYYRGAGHIVTVRDAVVRLGMQAVFSLTTSTALTAVLPARLPGYQVSTKSFLDHSLGVAVFAERVSKSFAPEVERVAFTAGLLHDLGKLVVGVFLGAREEQLRASLEGARLSMLESEQQLLGTDHGEVGLAVCERWGLPSLIGLAARHHHAPGEAPAGDARRLCEVVHVADALAHLVGLSNDVGELSRRLDEQVVLSLGIEPGELEALAADSFAQIQSMSELMSGSAPGRPLAVVPAGG